MSRAVVVGGGLAGISASLDLADSGVSVTLIEVRPRLGGAAYSFERDGLWLDNGQHVFLRCCVEYRGLLDRIGASADAHLQPRLEIPVLAPGGRSARLARVRLPAPLHLGPALLRYGMLSRRERVRAALTASALGRLDRSDPQLDRASFGQWLRERGENDRSIGALWDLIAVPTLNLHADDASLALATMVFQTGLLGASDAGDIGYARVPLGHLHDGPSRRALAGRGVEVRCGTRVTAVSSPRAGGLEVELAAGGALAAEAVVVAVPPDRAAKLLPGEAGGGAAAVAARGVSPIVNLHLVYDRPVTDLPFAAGVGTKVQWFFDRTESSGLRQGQCLAVSLSAADEEMQLSSGELRTRFVAAIEALLPRARDARLERFHVTREHAATFRATPGIEQLRPGPRTAVEGLVLAGAWTDTEWPATMEGAVRSGRAAAREALTALARRGRDAAVAA